MSEIDIQLFSRRILIDHYAVKENSISIFMILKKIWYAKVLQFPLYIYNIFHITYTQDKSFYIMLENSWNSFMKNNYHCTLVHIHESIKRRTFVIYFE